MMYAILQFDSAYGQGDRVYNTGEKDESGRPKLIARWICCKSRLSDGTVVYRLKDKKPGETDSRVVAEGVREEDLEEVLEDE